MEYFTEPSCKGKLLQQLAHVQEQLNIWSENGLELW
jgi:hypothetical protein